MNFLKMKTKLSICHVIVLMQFTQLTLSQSNLEQIQYYANLNQISSETLTNVSTNNHLNTQVFVQQIGTQNYLNITISSENLSYKINQLGKNNKIDVYKLTTNNNNESIIQSGNNNFISQHTYFSNSNIDRIVTQQGNNLNIQSYGENSISSKLQIYQSGNSGNILIFNR